jgi:DNA-binding transcriptional MerR regulator
MELDLDPHKRYKEGLIRVSAKGNIDKLDDQRGTGVAVYAHLPDFAALKDLPMDVATRDWMAIRYSDLNPAASSKVFGHVGLVGETLFVAVADSAVKANLPPDPSDPARIGRNAYIDLVAAVAIAGYVSDIYVPFRSRWWRNDLYANQLMAAINRRLPGCTLWEGERPVATTGAEKIITDLTGRTEGSGNAEAFAEQVYTKGLEHLEEGGQWDRRESELPLGLGRKRVTHAGGIIGKSLEVEKTRYRAVAAKALAMRARGETWETVGQFLAKRGVPMTGTKAGGRTFAQYPTTRARTAATRQLLLKHLHWYRTGEMTVRRSTKLERDQVRGQQLEFDPETGRRYRDVRVNLPWQAFLTDEQWAAFDRHEAEDAKQRDKSRKTGAATHDQSPGGAAFKGVPRWGEEETLAPKTKTAYHWRRGDTIEATLRRTLLHRGAGLALVEVLRHIEQPLADAHTRTGDDDPLLALERCVTTLDEVIKERHADSDAADGELLRATRERKSEREIDHWRQQGGVARQELWRVEDDRASAAANLANARENLVEVAQMRDADVTEAVLLASLLAEGDKGVDPLVATLCERYEITSTLQCRWDDGPIGRQPDQRPGRLVRLEATASIPLLDGGIHRVPITWTVEDSHEAPGDLAISWSMVRLWAAGTSYDDIAACYPDVDARRVRKRIREKLRAAGVVGSGLRSSLMVAPVVAPRAIIAALVLGDSSLDSPYTEELRSDVRAAYMGSTARYVGVWCSTAGLEEDRRVLEVLASAEFDADDDMDTTALARNAAVPREHIYRMSKNGLLEKVSHTAVRARRCTFHDSQLGTPCGGPMTIFTPGPEAGLICSVCWRPEGRSGQLGEEYTKHWYRETDGTYLVKPAPAVSPARRNRDRHLSVSEVAGLLGIPAWAVRELDRDGELLPDSRAGINHGRLYLAARIESVSDDARERWRTRFGESSDSDLLWTSDVAALLDCSSSLVRDFANAGLLTVASVTTGGQRRFKRADIDQLDRAGVEAYRMTPMGEACTAVGLTYATLWRLVNQGKVDSLVTSLGHHRFDLDELRVELSRLDLLGSPDSPIVAIGELARHDNVRLSTGQVRTLTNQGVIRCAGRFGDNRRYHLADALADVAEWRRRGVSSVANIDSGGER